MNIPIKDAYEALHRTWSDEQVNKELNEVTERLNEIVIRTPNPTPRQQYFIDSIQDSIGRLQDESKQRKEGPKERVGKPIKTPLTEVNRDVIKHKVRKLNRKAHVAAKKGNYEEMVALVEEMQAIKPVKPQDHSARLKYIHSIYKTFNHHQQNMEPVTISIENLNANNK